MKTKSKSKPNQVTVEMNRRHAQLPTASSRETQSAASPFNRKNIWCRTLVQTGRFDPTPLLTHSFSLDEITEGNRVFGERLDGVLKVDIKP